MRMDESYYVVVPASIYAKIAHISHEAHELLMTCPTLSLQFTEGLLEHWAKKEDKNK